MKSPYNSEFIEEQKQKLLEDKIRIEKELEPITTYDEEEGKYVAKFEELNPDSSEDNAEAADEETNYEENISLSQDLIKSLEEIKAALQKITGETYGYCSNCDEYISEDRLKAYPAAATCMKCEKE